VGEDGKNKIQDAAAGGKKRPVLKGAGILAVCAVIAKLIGAMYRIPLTNIVGAQGIGLYQMVFPLYTVLLTVSSGGLPVAISRVVAERIAKADEAGARRVLFTSLVSLSLIGLAASAAVVLFRAPIAAVQGNPAAALPYLGIAPSVTFVAVISAFRGYYQGKQNMLPSALSQLTEQVIKLGAGLSLARLMLPMGVEYGVLGALLGVSVSELVTLAALAGQFLITDFCYKKRTRIPIAAAGRVAAGSRMRPAAEAAADEGQGAGGRGQGAGDGETKNEKRKTNNGGWDEAKDVGLKIPLLRGVRDARDERSADGVESKITNKDANREAVKRKKKKGKSAGINQITNYNGQITNADENYAVGREPGSVAAESPAAPIHYSLSTIHLPSPTSHSSLLIPNSPPSAVHPPPPTKRGVLKEIYRVAIPVTLGSLVMPLTQVVDSILVINLLVRGGADRTGATSLFGLMAGPVSTLLNMPAVITLSFAIALLPKVSECFFKKESGAACGAIEPSLKYGFILGLFSSLAFAVFGGAIFSVLYARGLTPEEIRIGTALLWVGGVSVLYVSVLQVATSVLQGANQAHKPAINLLYGAAVKIILTLALLPFFGIVGAMAASAACYGVTCFLDVRSMLKVAPVKLKAREFLWAPVLAGAGFAGTGFALLKLFSGILSPLAALISAGAASLLVFCALLFVFGAIKREELKSLPVVGKLFK